MVGPRITARVNPTIHQIDDILDLTAKDMKQLTTKIDARFRANERELFSTEGSSGGVKWRPLKAATLAAKKRRAAGVRGIRKRGFSIPLASTSLKIMQRTGELRKGLTRKSHPDHVVRWVLSAGVTTISIGVKSPLPVYHGAVRGRARNSKLPRRSVFQMKPRQRRGYYEFIFERFDLKRRQWHRAMRVTVAKRAA